MPFQSNSGATMGDYSTHSLVTGTMFEQPSSRLLYQKYLLQGLTVCLSDLRDSMLILIIVAEASGISGLAEGKDAARTALQTRKYLSEFQHAICAPERSSFPVIVALHGHVIGLGIDLIGPCDIRYAASTASFSIKVCMSLMLLKRR